ncbi:MAG: sulfatase-like hydrolase/transferase [Verrucomicrobia bacterium]|nr:sulfatase-like hydrolase/transferase [Verrucomicrobiota bacterium]
MRADRLACWTWLVATLASPLLSLSAESSPPKPNIIAIVADDLGWRDVSWHGGKAKMPALDRLAATGVRLEQHYVFPLCSPTRAALLTGRYASRFGCTKPSNPRVLPFDTVTLASALKGAGYDTAITGKWHLGSLPEWGPQKFGFDFGYGSLAGGVGPYDHRYKSGPFTKTWHRNGQLIEEEGHVTDLIAREAVRFVETKRDRPFFLYVPFTAIHIPMDEPEKWQEMNAHFTDEGERLRAACESHMDDAIGQVVASVERLKQRENTLIIFFGDNGAHRALRNNDPQYPGKHPHLQVGNSNAPLRGGKAELFEGGIRVPALINWPGRLKPGEISAPLHVVDWMPTFCALAGWKPAKDLKWDGRDIWPVLSGAQPRPETRTLYWLGPNRRASAIRHGDWKLNVPKDKPAELYDLVNDLSETKNVAEQHPGRVAELKKRMAEQAARDDDAKVKEEVK